MGVAAKAVEAEMSARTWRIIGFDRNSDDRCPLWNSIIVLWGDWGNRQLANLFVCSIGRFVPHFFVGRTDRGISRVSVVRRLAKQSRSRIRHNWGFSAADGRGWRHVFSMPSLTFGAMGRSRLGPLTGAENLLQTKELEETFRSIMSGFGWLRLPLSARYSGILRNNPIPKIGHNRNAGLARRNPGLVCQICNNCD